MKILVIDGQGGGIGKALISRVRQEGIQAKILALGTNSAATINMKKSLPDASATGESAIRYNCKNMTKSDFILGPIGIVNAYSLCGEISPAIVVSVTSSEANKILLPSQKCSMYIAGVVDKTLSQYIDDMIGILLKQVN